MPAGYGKRCARCYWTELLEKRIAINTAAFGIPAMAQHFANFCRWLAIRVGDNKAAITIHRYLPFFTEMEREWRGIPSYAALVQRFGAEQLRRVRLPITWLSETAEITPDARVRKANSDERRIANLLRDLPDGSPQHALLEMYSKELRIDVENSKLTIRSARLALTPTVALLRMAVESEKPKPNQLMLEDYLDRVPGQRAAISRFIRYLRENHGACLALPKLNVAKSQFQRRQKLEDEMLRMIWKGGHGEAFMREWIPLALAYFHGLPRKTLRHENIINIELGRDTGATIKVDGKSYWIPFPPTSKGHK